MFEILEEHSFHVNKVPVLFGRRRIQSERLAILIQGDFHVWPVNSKQNEPWFRQHGDSQSEPMIVMPQFLTSAGTGEIDVSVFMNPRQFKTEGAADLDKRGLGPPFQLQVFLQRCSSGNTIRLARNLFEGIPKGPDISARLSTLKLIYSCPALSQVIGEKTQSFNMF